MSLFNLVHTTTNKQSYNSDQKSLTKLVHTTYNEQGCKGDQLSLFNPLHLARNKRSCILSLSIGRVIAGCKKSKSTCCTSCRRTQGGLAGLSQRN